MDPNSFDDLPEELRPSAARHRAMRLVGLALVVVGCLLLAGAAAWWSVGTAGLGLPSDGHHVSLAVFGGVSLTHGITAVVTVNSS